MAKQEELRALLNAFKEAVRIDARYAHLDGPASNETSGVAEKRIFSFFDQMRQTIDGLTADVERRDQLRRDDVQAKDTFAPFDPGRENLEVLVGMPDAGEWLAADYIGKSSKGFHVVEADGRGIVCVTDATVGLRHRVKAKPMKTVTLWANLRRDEEGNIFGELRSDEARAKLIAGPNQVIHVTKPSFATIPVKVTVAE